MKKLAALALSLLMLCSVFTSCGDSGNNNSNGTGQSGSASETLTVWCWDEEFNIAAMRTAEQYYKEAGHENFTLDIVNVVEDDLQTKISTAFSANVTEELPDIILMGDSWEIGRASCRERV